MIQHQQQQADHKLLVQEAVIANVDERIELGGDNVTKKEEKRAGSQVSNVSAPSEKQLKLASNGSSVDDYTKFEKAGGRMPLGVGGSISEDILSTPT